MTENPVSGPNDESAVEPSVDAFLDTDRHNLDSTRRHLPEFRELVPRVYSLYDLARTLIPPISDPMYGRALLLCDKAFLSAAATIGRGHPEDAGAITRRAIEIARTVVAIKHHPENRERWKAEEQRARREAGRKDRALASRPKLKWPVDHPLLTDLRKELGLLSDIYVHFTPEYAARQHWHHETGEERTAIYLPYHCPDERVIRQQLILLVGIHFRMLALLDECYDQAFSRDATWRRRYLDARAARDQLGNSYLETRPREDEETT